ncbi:hypothetical protein HJC23_013188 [Cyclotella cryptica]|uniref:Retrovirus-related Pol polyprotein from transposon TNT 1-94-like beta-barrel domain-containing protein n=1 Tax=Cyclotella cryptica TaxID=29204 RepID=A0ABD3QCQ9_9STRA|eukprot:CCRYP_006593-RA/>CCRYP_006593-RA protein AED:0.00 eAED:0.00 QI:245/-1/1/1/-1/1/1/502/613
MPADPPGSQWQSLPHKPNRIHLNLRVPQNSSKESRSQPSVEYPSVQLTGHRHRRASMQGKLKHTLSRSPPLEMFLEKREANTSVAKGKSIPSTASTSSCTSEDDSYFMDGNDNRTFETKNVFSDERDASSSGELCHEQTLAIDAWNEVAGEYHKRVEPFTSLFLPFLLNRQFLGRHGHEDDVNYLGGKSVLDVATGTGAGALYAVSRGASLVTAVDFSEEMLRIVEKRANFTPAHYGNVSQPRRVETRLADGHSLPSEWANKYDIACSNFGVIYFSQVNEGLGEMVRCTKPGGKVCFSAWERKEMSNAFRIFPAAVKLCGLEHKWMRAFSRQSNKASFFLPTKRISADRNILHGLMCDAGLKNVHIIGPFSREVRLSSAEEYWHRFVLACPNVKRVVEHFFTENERQSLKETVKRLLIDEAEYDSSHSESTSSAALESDCCDMSLSPISLTKIANATSKVAIADSGATHHLWPDYSAFISYEKVSNRFVSLADKSTAPIVGFGDVAVSLGGKNIVLRNVYHVPSLRAPLYSLRAHRRLSGCGFIGDNDCFQICFPGFSLTVNDDVDSYIEYLPLGKKIAGSEDYIQPRSRSLLSRNGCIMFSASAYIAFGTKA